MNTQKVLMLKGLPASGKSTFAIELAQSPFWLRVNKDELRKQLFPDKKWSGKQEKAVLAERDRIIVNSLYLGLSVVVDDTNFHPKHERRIRELVDGYNKAENKNVEFEVKYFDVPLHECIQRDAKRENPVGAIVIRRMWRQYCVPDAPPYDPNLPNAVICDLDGTLALFKGNPYERDFSQDTVNAVVSSILFKYFWSDVDIIITSARSGKFRDVTENWLKDNNITYDYLYMREEDDNRPDYVVKKEIYENHIKDKYNVLFCLDDRNQVVDLWRGLGLTCLQVNYGDF